MYGSFASHLPSVALMVFLVAVCFFCARPSRATPESPVTPHTGRPGVAREVRRPYVAVEPARPAATSSRTAGQLPVSVRSFEKRTNLPFSRYDPDHPSLQGRRDA